jgi:hypothetical protein
MSGIALPKEAGGRYHLPGTSASLGAPRSGGGDIVHERAAPLRLLGVIAPALDLEAGVELGRGKGRFRVESSLGERQRHH